MKALIADDSNIQRDQISDWLGEMGIEVVTAIDGHEAWEQYNSSFDLLILDQMMPSCTGIEFCRRLWQQTMTNELEAGRLKRNDYNKLSKEKAFLEPELEKAGRTLINKNTPTIIFLTSNPMDIDKREASYLGINYWVLKPVQKQQFVELVASILKVSR